MSDTSLWLRPRLGAPAPPPNHFAAQALERHKREGMELALRARFVALAVVAVMLPFLNPSFEMIYYEGLLVALAINGWAQRRVAKVGQSRREMALIFVDLFLMTAVLIGPNPLAQGIQWPTAMTYRFENFIYFFVILAAATLAYSWRTITTIGTWTAGLWMLGALMVWLYGHTDPPLTQAVAAALPDPRMANLLDPNAVQWNIRTQQVVVFLLVAATLALGVRRNHSLLMAQAEAERERTNLARYFSPNVVAELSDNDEPLKQTRTQGVAVLFVDIVGFTHYAAHTPPDQVIATLRQFHSRMEAEVFRHDGTLDKYLGDGLMATFGTPMTGETDALDALRCARAMLASIDAWNTERAMSDAPTLRIGLGLHYGPVVLGNIGANRLEFAVIGNTVNVASRVEGLTRALSVDLAASQALRDKVLSETGGTHPALDGLEQTAPQSIRGLDEKLGIWTLGQAPRKGGASDLGAREPRGARGG